MIPLYLMVLSILKFVIEFKNLLYCFELNKNIKVIISMLQYLVRRNPKHAFLSTDEKAGIFENIYPTYKCKNKKKPMNAGRVSFDEKLCNKYSNKYEW